MARRPGPGRLLVQARHPEAALQLLDAQARLLDEQRDLLTRTSEETAEAQHSLRMVEMGLDPVLKFTVLYTGLYLLVKHDVVAIMPLAVGWGALPLGIVAGQTGAAPSESEKGHVDA